MLPDGWYFDSIAFWILNALMLWDGMQRVPAGAWVLRHVAGYSWHVAHAPRETAGRRLVSWLSPVVCHVVLAPGPGTGRTPPRHLGRWMTLLRIPAAAALLSIIIGVPLLTPTMAFRGLLIALAAGFGAALVTALLSVLALWRMGTPLKSAVGHSFGILSPFTAPRAPEIVLARGLEGVAFADAIRALLPPDAYVEWARPVAYDLSHGVAVGDDLLPAGDVQAILRRPPPGTVPGDVYCARCGRVYLPSAAGCRACEGVELVTVGEEPVIEREAAPAEKPAPVPVAAAAAAPAVASAPERKGKRRGKTNRADRHR